jgi:cysteine desulfurase
VSAIEHRSVLAPIDELAESMGYEVRRAPVTPDGTIDLASLDELLDDDVLLVAVHLANNEIGTIQPVAEVAARARMHGALVLCDATQAVGKVSIDVHELGVDLLSLSAHKFHGPKGAGALYLRPDVPIAPQLTGGGQEHGLRAGTPNVPAIVGMGVAAREAVAHLVDGEVERIRARRDRLEAAILELCPRAFVNGAGAPRTAGIASVTFRGCCGAQLVQSMPELAISRGSACSTGSPKPSHVLTALGLAEEDAFATLRISLGVSTTDADVDRAIDAFRRSLDGLAA